MTAIERLPNGGQAGLALGIGVRTKYERDAGIHDVFAQRAAAAPDSIAVVHAAGAMSYAELDRRSNQLAHFLRSLGVGPETLVGIALERSAAVPAVLLAVLKAGGAYVPLDPSYPRDRFSFIVHDADVTLILADGAVRERIPASGIPIVDLLVAAPAIAEQSEAALDEPGRPDALAYVMYTSGSTGRPKGVAVVHRAVVRLVRHTDYVDIDTGDVVLQYAPLAFDASTFEIWAPLLNGAQLAIAPPGLLSLPELERTLARFEVTTLWLTAPVFREAVEGRIGALRGLRRLLAGGDVVSAVHAKRFVEAYPDCRLINGYGPTENTTFSCCYVVPSPDAIAESVPIGRPIANSSAFVLDSQLQPVPFGVEGELFVGGDGLALGYVNLPAVTAERFIPDPFSSDPSARLYRTGDRARWRPDGLLEFLGRNDDQVKVRGFRIELGEIESAFQKHEAVAGTAVVVTERDGEKELAAHVVLRAGAVADEHELRAWLRDRLPSYMTPHRIVFRSELPLTSNGKVDRAALASAPPASGTRPAANVSHAGLERAVAEIWRDVLHVDAAPGLDENFFDAGGDSLRLLAVHARLHQTIGAELSVTDLFEHSTIRRLAAFLGRARGRV